MGVVLCILTVLGKVILWLLGILCLLLLCILFYPIKYQLEAEFRQNIKMRGRIQWFWFLFRLHVSYEETFQWDMRLFGLDLMKLLDKGGRTEKRKWKKKEREKAENRKTTEQKEKVIEQSGAELSESNSTVVEQDGGTERSLVYYHSDDRIEDAEQEQERAIAVNEKESRNVFQKIIQFVKKWHHKLCDFIFGIKRFCRRLRKKTKFAREMVSLFRQDNSKVLVCIIKDNVVHLWRKLKPRVFRGHLLFGTGNPASTGELLGLFALLYVWYGDSIKIVPDFERKILEGEIFMKGRISLFTILLVLVRVFLSDEWKRFRREYDRINASC